MDRRTIEATIYGTLFAFGGAAMIGSFALPDSSPYFQILLVAGLLGLAVGFIGLVYLWWTAPRSKEAPPAPDKQQGSIGIYLGPGVKGAVVEDNTINGMDTAIEDIANMPSAESEWRPIETAPKDGTLVILYSPAEEAVCVGVFDHCLWHCAERHQPDNGEFGFDGFEDATPSHWMPLPEFPA